MRKSRQFTDCLPPFAESDGLSILSLIRLPGLAMRKSRLLDFVYLKLYFVYLKLYLPGHYTHHTEMTILRRCTCLHSQEILPRGNKKQQSITGKFETTLSPTSRPAWQYCLPWPYLYCSKFFVAIAGNYNDHISGGKAGFADCLGQIPRSNTQDLVSPFQLPLWPRATVQDWTAQVQLTIIHLVITFAMDTVIRPAFGYALSTKNIKYFPHAPITSMLMMGKWQGRWFQSDRLALPQVSRHAFNYFCELLHEWCDDLTGLGKMESV